VSYGATTTFRVLKVEYQDVQNFHELAVRSLLSVLHWLSGSHLNSQ